MRTHRSVAGCVVVVWLVALLAERSEEHITFFSPKEMMLMKVREGRKEIESQLEEPQSDTGSIQQLPRVERGANPDKTVDIALRLSPKQLDHVGLALEKIIQEIVNVRKPNSED